MRNRGGARCVGSITLLYVLGFFKPKCPCDIAAKHWIESKLVWLSDQFPKNVFTGAPVVLPTREFFPEPVGPRPESVRWLVSHIAKRMGVDPDRIIVRLTHDPKRLNLVNASGQALPHVAGTFSAESGRYIITIDTDEVADLTWLIGTIAHELAHALLIGERRLNPRNYDNELLTDLTALFLGYGLFLANAPRNWDSAFTRWPASDLNKPEYMTPPMFGYALAHIAWALGEEKPVWRDHLRRVVTTDFDQSLKFLFKTGNTSFRKRPRLLRSD